MRKLRLIKVDDYVEVAAARNRRRLATAEEADRLRGLLAAQTEAIYALEEEVTRLRAKVKAYEAERERLREELS